MKNLNKQVKDITDVSHGSASPGEKIVAAGVKDTFESHGANAFIEEAPAVGNYWLPLGVLSGLSFLLSFKPRKHRAIKTVLATAAALAVWDDITARKRVFRRLLPKRKTYNVLGWFGPETASKTIVFVSHHDSAKSGIIFHPGIPDLAWKVAPKKMEANETGPPVMLPVVLAPLVVALGTALGSKRIARLGSVLTAAVSAAFIDIACRGIVPGANDNATGVVCLQELAAKLKANPLSADTRVLLLSTGSEESLLEGMNAFAKDWFPRLDKENTFFIAVDSVGSEHLCFLAGEGMLRMRSYPTAALSLAEAAAAELDIPLIKGLKHRNSTDALYPLKAGYPTVMLGSVNDRRLPDNYHWKTDTHDKVNYQSLDRAIKICEHLARKLDKGW